MRFRYLIILLLFCQMGFASAFDLCDCHCTQSTASQSHCAQCSHQRPANQINTLETKRLPLTSSKIHTQPQQVLELNVSISGPYRPPTV